MEEWNIWANEQPWANEWNKWNEWNERQMKTAVNKIKTTIKRNRKREVKNDMSEEYFETSTDNSEIRLEDSDAGNINNLYDLPDDNVQDELWWTETSGEVS